MQRRDFLATAGLGATIGLAGCSGSVPGGGSTTTVSVGSASSGSTGLLMEVLLSEGLDEEYGIEIEPERAPAPEVTQLLVNEAVDVAYSSPQGAANANLQGRDIRIYGPWLADHNSLMVLPDSDIGGWEDLMGQRVGTLPEASGMFNHAAIRLAAEDMDFNEDFDLRKGNPGAIHSFNQNQEVAAHLHFPPVSIKAMQQQSFQEIEFLPNKLEELFGRNLHFVSLAAYQDFLDNNTEAAQAVRSALLDAAQLVNDDPETYISQNQDFTGFENDEQVQLASERAPAMYPTEWNDEARNNIVDQLEKSKELGTIPEDAPTDVIGNV